MNGALQRTVSCRRQWGGHTHFVSEKHLEDDVELLPPGPLVLHVVELVQGDHRHQLTLLHTRHIVRRLEHFPAVQNLQQLENIMRTLLSRRPWVRPTWSCATCRSPPTNYSCAVFRSQSWSEDMIKFAAFETLFTVRGLCIWNFLV